MKDRKSGIEVELKVNGVDEALKKTREINALWQNINRLIDEAKSKIRRVTLKILVEGRWMVADYRMDTRYVWRKRHDHTCREN